MKASNYCTTLSDCCIKHVSQLIALYVQGGQNEESRVGEGQGRAGGLNINFNLIKRAFFAGTYDLVEQPSHQSQN